MEKPWGFRRKLGVEITFEHSPGKTVEGDVCEVGIDGSFLVRPRHTPKEWSWDDLEDRRLGRVVPTFFLVDPDPGNRTHVSAHRKVGYKFDPSKLGTSLLERIRNFTVFNPSARAGAWYVEQVRKMGLALEEEFQTFRIVQFEPDSLYFTVSDSVYFAKTGRLCRLDAKGIVTEILQAPGRFLAVNFHPLEPDRLLVSAEGYPKDDPRWQCLYELNRRAGDYRVIQFPKPTGNDLFGTPKRFFPDHGIALLNRYGFVPEGGGLWLMGIDNPDYEPKRRLLGWDHSQVWMFFPTLNPLIWNVFFTAKEVDNDFAMTVNRAVLYLDGPDTQLTEPVRIAKVRGWNPIPFHTERVGEYQHLVYVASNSHEDYMASRPSGVYVFEVPS